MMTAADVIVMNCDKKGTANKKYSRRKLKWIFYSLTHFAADLCANKRETFVHCCENATFSVNSVIISY